MMPADYKLKLKELGLKVTPQRLAVLEAVNTLHNHPTADEVGQFIRKMYPNIGTGTVYKTLDTLVEKGIIRRVKTERGLLRYDPITNSHHHLYCAVSERIEDYYDEELSKMLEDYFSMKKIKGFDIDEIRLQIIGRFPECDVEKHKSYKH
jgi:Fur family peroxide stress response transcriptional regulator